MPLTQTTDHQQTILSSSIFVLWLSLNDSQHPMCSCHHSTKHFISMLHIKKTGFFLNIADICNWLLVIIIFSIMIMADRQRRVQFILH